MLSPPQADRRTGAVHYAPPVMGYNADMGKKKFKSPELKARTRPLKIARTLANKLRRVLRSSGIDAANDYSRKHGLKMPAYKSKKQE